MSLRLSLQKCGTKFEGQKWEKIASDKKVTSLPNKTKNHRKNSSAAQIGMTATVTATATATKI
jgi:hypothetical protein